MLRSPGTQATAFISGNGNAIGAGIRNISTSQGYNANDCTLVADATAGAIIVTLPLAANSVGRILGVKKKDSSANTVTAKGNGSETIDGANTSVLAAQWQYIFLQSDGVQWYVI